MATWQIDGMELDDNDAARYLIAGRKDIRMQNSELVAQLDAANRRIIELEAEIAKRDAEKLALSEELKKGKW